jgi:serine/threonine protein kinase
MPFQDINFTDCRIDKYHFKKLLGRGGFGSVWLADEYIPPNKFLRQVAIKVFVDDTNNKQSFQQTLLDYQRDVEPLAQLAPSNPIVPYYNAVVEDIYVNDRNEAETVGSRTDLPEGRALTALLIVMEYADGGSLARNAEYRDANIRQDGRGYLGHFYGVASALHAAHQENLVHRDIKPANVLWFRTPNNVKVTDFGIAKNLLEGMPFDSQVMGSLPYMSPESFAPGNVSSPERDVYALGCTYYEILVGEEAFRSDASSNYFEDYATVHSTAPRPEAFIKAKGVVSLAMSDLITRMMSIKVEERPKLDQVMQLIQDELQKITTSSKRVTQVQGTSSKHLRRVVHGPAYNINPRFRKEHLSESLYLLFMNIPIQTENKYNILLSVCNEYFDNSYSLYELFGRYDFVLRVWGKAGHIDSLCAELQAKLLEDDATNLHAFLCDEVSYLGESSLTFPENLDIREALVMLDKVQRKREPEEGELKWLMKNRVYVRRKKVLGSKECAKAFCLVSASGVTSAIRDLYGLHLKDELSKDMDQSKRSNVTLYRRALNQSLTIQHEPSDFCLKYGVTKYQEVIGIPAFILSKFNAYRLKTTTLLGTGRFYIESDRARLTGIV